MIVSDLYTDLVKGHHDNDRIRLKELLVTNIKL